MGFGAKIENAGTFSTKGEAKGLLNIGGEASLVHNATGATFRSEGGEGLGIGVPFDNDGTVEASAGTLSLSGGDTGSTEGIFKGAGANGVVSFQSNLDRKSVV